MPTLRNASRWLLPALATGMLVVGCSKNDTTTTSGPTTAAAGGSSSTTAKAGTSTTQDTYGDKGSPGTTSKTSGSTPGSTPAGAATVKIASSEFGDIAVDGEGRTLYVFKKDTGTESMCTGGCVTAWPPFAGPATAGTGIGADDLATTTRADGAVQVTFYGHPLYHFSGDEKAGEVNGQGVGDVWYVVGADGNPITKK